MLRDVTAATYRSFSEDGAKTDSSILLRRFTGPEARELFVVCRPQCGAADVSRRADAVYRDITALLAAEGASAENVTYETLFFRDIRRDLSTVLDARALSLGNAGRSSLPLTVIEQPPLVAGAPFEVSVAALIPRRRRAWSVREVRGTPRCPCESCARVAARLVRLADQTSFHSGNVHGSGANAFDEAYDMFRAAEELLREAGMSFPDVLRTWIYLRDIDRDYAALNRARREFFRSRGVELRPASTGIGGGPFPQGHDFSISLYAARATRPLDVASMSAPTLGEAWRYGADFSRGLRVVEANKVALYVAGTASVDEAGRTVHVGDFESQVDRMLVNISSLLAAEGASFRNVLSAVTYVKRPSDVAVLRTMFHDHGFDGFPITLVEAPICRPDLLCETEVVAALPLPCARA